MHEGGHCGVTRPGVTGKEAFSGRNGQGGPLGEKRGNFGAATGTPNVATAGESGWATTTAKAVATEKQCPFAQPLRPDAARWGHTSPPCPARRAHSRWAEARCALGLPEPAPGPRLASGGGVGDPPSTIPPSHASSFHLPTPRTRRDARCGDTRREATATTTATPAATPAAAAAAAAQHPPSSPGTTAAGVYACSSAPSTRGKADGRGHGGPRAAKGGQGRRRGARAAKRGEGQESGVTISAASTVGRVPPTEGGTEQQRGGGEERGEPRGG